MKFNSIVLSITMISACMPILGMDDSMTLQFDNLRDLKNSTYIQDATEKIKQELNLCDPHSKIRDIAEEALATCGITEPVIILQDQNVSDSVVHRLPRLGDMLVVVAGVKGDVPLPFIKWSIYHECAHILYDANSSNTLFMLGEGALDIGAGYYVASQCNAVMQKALSKYPRYLVNALVFVATGEAVSRAYHKVVGNYVSRTKERRADIFAAQTLIHKKHDITSCVVSFINFNLNDTFALFNDHPSDKERAEIILKELKKANIDFEDLPLDAEALEGTPFSKERLQSLFTQKVRKYFPSYLESRSESLIKPS